jgi:hypothetical protein
MFYGVDEIANLISSFCSTQSERLLAKLVSY